MATKLIELDGVIIEAEVPENEARETSARFADLVQSSFSKITPLLKSVCRPVAQLWKDQAENDPIGIQQAEIRLGLNFEGSGNLYITKSKAGANLSIKLTLKPKTE